MLKVIYKVKGRSPEIPPLSPPPLLLGCLRLYFPSRVARETVFLHPDRVGSSP